MNDRDLAYLRMLHFALPILRNLAAGAHTQDCLVELEHIHNIPSLIGEANEHRHAYYYLKERQHYLDHVNRDTPGVSFLLDRYAELWPELEKFANEANSRQNEPPEAIA